MVSCLNIDQSSRYNFNGVFKFRIKWFQFWFRGPKILWEDFDFSNIVTQKLHDPVCSMYVLLDSNKICLLVQENSKTDLKIMRLENSYCLSVTFY